MNRANIVHITVCLFLTGCKDSIPSSVSSGQNPSRGINDSEPGMASMSQNHIDGGNVHKPAKVSLGRKPSDYSKNNMEIIAFGDWGTYNSNMVQTMRSFHKLFPNPDAVFLLGDNFYSDPAASTFDLFTKHVAPPGTSNAHYVILGNHDYSHGLNKQLSYNNQDPRWILPSKYYFHRFKRNGFDVCVWFLDTEGILRGDSAQILWLDSSLQKESPTCRWKIVNGHHPLMHASPIRGQCPRPLTPLRPLMSKYKVHLVLAGHHHNSQFMQHQPSGVYYAIAGAIVDLRSEPDATKYPVFGRNFLWGSGKSTALLRLNIDKNNLQVEFCSGSKTPLFTHTIM